MRQYLAILLVSVVLMLSACGGGSSGGGGSSSKDLFSLWNDIVTDQPLDLRGATFDPFTLSLFFGDGSQCDCVLSLLGDQSSGSWVRNFCVYRIGSGPQDPGCNSLNDTGTYRKINNQLQIVDSSSNLFVYR
jgi:hypothetical protein